MRPRDVRPHVLCVRYYNITILFYNRFYHRYRLPGTHIIIIHARTRSTRNRRYVFPPGPRPGIARLLNNAMPPHRAVKKKKKIADTLRVPISPANGVGRRTDFRGLNKTERLVTGTRRLPIEYVPRLTRSYSNKYRFFIFFYCCRIFRPVPRRRVPPPPTRHIRQRHNIII